MADASRQFLLFPPTFPRILFEFSFPLYHQLKHRQTSWSSMRLSNECDSQLRICCSVELKRQASKRTEEKWNKRKKYCETWVLVPLPPLLLATSCCWFFVGLNCARPRIRVFVCVRVWNRCYACYACYIGARQYTHLHICTSSSAMTLRNTYTYNVEL